MNLGFWHSATLKKLMFLSSHKLNIELLIDGGVFAQMLTADVNTLKELNLALQKAAAVIIYRASPK